MTQIEHLIEQSYNLGMIQNHLEILQASYFFKELKVKDFIEIGTNQGGTFNIWSNLSDKDGLKISIDLPGGDFGTEVNLQQRDNFLKSLGSNVYLLHGDSHTNNMYNKLKDLLQGRKVDFLFIDGDHTYLGVKLDFLMYKEFVRPGGFIAFHDIKDTEFHRSVNCRVDQLWQELDFQKTEFLEPSTDFGGIGFILV